MSYELRHKDAVSGRVREDEYEHIRQHILNDQAAGDMVYASSATQLSGLPKGTAGVPLVMGASLPQWGGRDVDVGAYDVRGQTVTADALTSGRVVFTGASGVLSDDSDFLFATDTLTVTKIAATTFTGVITMTLASAVASHLIIAGTAKINSGEQAIYINFPLETVAVNGLWVTIGSTVTSGDLTGIRSRVTGNAASAGANVRGAYLEAKAGASKFAAMLEGALLHADYSAGSVTISGDVRGFSAQISQGSSLNAANLYGGLINIQTRGDENITTDDVGLMIRNEAVGGNGRTMDTAITIADLNMGGATDGFALGVDFSGATITTADIKFHHGQTIVSTALGIELPTIAKAGLALSVQNTTDAASNQVATFGGGNRATPANSDEGYVSFMLDNSGGTQQEFARMKWRAVNVTTGAGQFIFQATNASATLVEVMKFSYSSIVFNGGATDVNFLVYSDEGLSVIDFDAGTGNLILRPSNSSGDTLTLQAYDTGVGYVDVITIYNHAEPYSELGVTMKLNGQAFDAGSGNAEITTSGSLGLKMGGGLLCAEIASAVADVAGYGQFWVKNDVPNTPYFTDDTGVDRQIQTADYAGITIDGNAGATTIDVVDNFVLIDVFDTDMPERISNGAHGTNNITIGATGVYCVRFDMSGSGGGTNKTFEVFAFELNASGEPIASTTDANPVVVTDVGHPFVNGNRIKITGVTTADELNDRIFTVTKLTADTYSLQDDEGVNIDGTGFGAGTGGTATLATILTAVHTHRKFTTADVGSLSGGGLISLTKDKTLELYIKGITDATNPTIEHCSFYMNRVS